MIKCPYCNRITKPGEVTGTFKRIAYINPENHAEGIRILKSVRCCMNCAGEDLIK